MVRYFPSVDLSESLLRLTLAFLCLSGSQFFITTAVTAWLDSKHVVFGEVLDGYDVVQLVENAAKDGNDRPKKAITIVSSGEA